MNIETEADHHDSDERSVGDTVRCPKCDSVIDEAAEMCLMCGHEISVAQSKVITSTVIERQSKIMWWITGVITIIVIVTSIMIIKNPSAASVAIFPTATDLPPTMTWTPTSTATGSDRRYPAGGVRTDVLSAATVRPHRGRTQLKHSPEFPGRFTVGPIRLRLYAETRQLAEHGRD